MYCGILLKNALLCCQCYDFYVASMYDCFPRACGIYTSHVDTKILLRNYGYLQYFYLEFLALTLSQNGEYNEERRKKVDDFPVLHDKTFKWWAKQTILQQ